MNWNINFQWKLYLTIIFSSYDRKLKLRGNRRYHEKNSSRAPFIFRVLGSHPLKRSICPEPAFFEFLHLFPQFRTSDIRGSNRKFLFQDCGHIHTKRSRLRSWVRRIYPRSIQIRVIHLPFLLNQPRFLPRLASLRSAKALAQTQLVQTNFVTM